jgi:hypothetical protein
MRRRTTLAALAATAAFAAIPAQASAQQYEFRGTVAAVSGSTLMVQVVGGNHAGLKAIIGAPQPLTYTVGGRTRYTVWNGNRPHRGSLNDIGIGDRVWLRIDGRRNAPLANLLARPLRAVQDVSNKDLGDGRLFLFRGTCTGKDTTANKLTVTVTGGNWRALYAMLGQSVSQTFSYDDHTAFVSWSTGRPRKVDEDNVPCGADGTPLALRIRAPKLTPLATLVATPAALVNVREPAADDENAPV